MYPGYRHAFNKLQEEYSHAKDIATRPFRKVVVAVPHAAGPSEEQDDAAPIIGKAIADCLSRYGMPVHLHLASVSRVQVDLNRVEGRTHPWRRQLDAMIDEDTLLIDCHSYPADHAFMNPYDIVIYKNHCGDLKVTEKYADLLAEKAHSLRVSWEECLDYHDPRPNHTHDIVNCAYEKDVQAVLIEHNDALIPRADEVGEYHARACMAWDGFGESLRILGRKVSLGGYEPPRSVKEILATPGIPWTAQAEFVVPPAFNVPGASAVEVHEGDRLAFVGRLRGAIPTLHRFVMWPKDVDMGKSPKVEFDVPESDLGIFSDKLTR